MTEKLFNQISFWQWMSKYTKIWQSLFDYVYPIINDVWLWFSVRLSIINAWHCHLLCAALSCNVGEWDMWPCTFFFHLYYLISFLYIYNFQQSAVKDIEIIKTHSSTFYRKWQKSTFTHKNFFLARINLNLHQMQMLDITSFHHNKKYWICF